MKAKLYRKFLKLIKTGSALGFFNNKNKIKKLEIISFKIFVDMSLLVFINRVRN